MRQNIVEEAEEGEVQVVVEGRESINIPGVPLPL